MTIRYTGLVAPEETPTGDGRMFRAGGGTVRTPATVMVKFESGGHGNAVTVGKLVSTFDGPGGKWGTIEFLDPAIVPEVTKTCYMLDQKVLGPSVDLDQDYTVKVIPHPTRVGKQAALFENYNVVGVTLVPMPAFAEVHLSADTAEEVALLASAGVAVKIANLWEHPDVRLVHPYLETEPLQSTRTNFDINTKAWDAWPLAERAYKFDADDAVKRIAAWSGIGTKTPSLNHYASAFLWRDGSQAGDTLAQDSFRLPLADIINGQPHLIYHAVYAAAALLSGGHGGLPNIPAEDQERMKGVINQIYAKMAQAFGDSGMKSPFMGGGRQESQMSIVEEDDCGCTEPDRTAILAGLAPVAPPRSVFEMPEADGPTRFTVTADGRVFGHVAEWRKCHIGIGDTCVMAPRSKTNYKYFTLGSVICDDGSQVDVGVISYGSAHANDKYGVMPTRDFYDNSSKGGAVVSIKNGKYGIWISGVLTPNMTEVDAAELRRSKLSGDWRTIEGQFELVAALAVNAPGFPIVRSEGGSIFSMQGVGVVGDEPDVSRETEPEPEVDVSRETFAAKLEEINAKEQERRAGNKAKRIEEAGATREKLAQTSESTILARQYDAKFVVIPETQDAEK